MMDGIQDGCPSSVGGDGGLPAHLRQNLEATYQMANAALAMDTASVVNARGGRGGPG